MEVVNCLKKPSSPIFCVKDLSARHRIDSTLLGKLTMLQITFCSKKRCNCIFRPAFGMCSTQTLVEIYNNYAIIIYYIPFQFTTQIKHIKFSNLFVYTFFVNLYDKLFILLNNCVRTYVYMFIFKTLSSYGNIRVM